MGGGAAEASSGLEDGKESTLLPFYRFKLYVHPQDANTVESGAPLRIWRAGPS